LVDGIAGHKSRNEKDEIQRNECHDQIEKNLLEDKLRKRVSKRILHLIQILGVPDFSVFRFARADINSSAHVCSEIGLKWFFFLFCLSASDLGLFGEQLLAVLKNGNPWVPTNPKESRVFP
jgi:hypothetical protein